MGSNFRLSGPKSRYHCPYYARITGLRNRLHLDGVQVLTVKPGFVDISMIAAIEKVVLWANPETIAPHSVKNYGLPTPQAILPTTPFRPTLAIASARTSIRTNL